MTYPPSPSPQPQPPAPPPTPPVRPLPSYPALRSDANIQGNVLAGFNKDNQAILFLQLPDQARGKALLAELLPLVSTNADVADFNQRFSEARGASSSDPDDLSATWIGISLTFSGLQTLSPDSVTPLSEPQWDATIQRWEDGATTAPDIAQSGTESPTSWIVGRPDQSIHLMVVVASDSSKGLLGALGEIYRLVAIHDALVVFEQDGRVLASARHGHEHFGFKDGISQPGVMGYDEPDPNNANQVAGKPGMLEVEPGEFILGYPGHNRPSGRAVPLWMFDGSFLVLRRLRQDVPGWWAQSETLSTQLGAGAEAVGAKLVVRWRSGVPVAESPKNDPRTGPDRSSANDFDFSDDPAGSTTPLCAHIRKVNPRAGTVPGQDAVSQRRILRRGIPFGSPFDPASGTDHGSDAPRGLVFACYQASIGDQFEFLQQSWADAAAFPAPDTGPDPVIGPIGQATIPGATPEPVSFGRFVAIEGAIYAFTPSIPTLKLLAGGAPLPLLS